MPMTPEDKKALRQKRISEGICPDCGKHPSRPSKRMCEVCAEKYKTYHKRQYDKSKEKQSCWQCGRASGKTMCEDCALKRTHKRNERYRLGICGLCGKHPVVENKKSCIHCQKKQQERSEIIKDLVFNAYGGYACNCCGETIKEFLTIDHVNGDGAEHRRQLKNRNMYSWLKKNDFPSGFQVLCWNCNLGRRFGKECPHKRVIHDKS